MSRAENSLNTLFLKDMKEGFLREILDVISRTLTRYSLTGAEIFYSSALPRLFDDKYMKLIEMQLHHIIS